MPRDPSPVFPGVGQRAGSSLSSPGLLAGTGAPAGALVPPSAPATPCVAASVAGVPAQLSEHHACGTPAAASPFLCAVLGCDRPRDGKRYCAGHEEAYRTRAYDLTRGVGRGSYDEP